MSQFVYFGSPKDGRLTGEAQRHAEVRISVF